MIQLVFWLAQGNEKPSEASISQGWFSFLRRVSDRAAIVPTLKIFNLRRGRDVGTPDILIFSANASHHRLIALKLVQVHAPAADR